MILLDWSCLLVYGVHNCLLKFPLKQCSNVQPKQLKYDKFIHSLINQFPTKNNETEKEPQLNMYEFVLTLRGVAVGGM